MNISHRIFLMMALSALMIFSLMGCGREIWAPVPGQSQEKPQEQTQDTVLPEEEIEAEEPAEPQFTADDTAKAFSQLWSKEWETLSQNIMTNGEGRGFLADLDGDKQDELIFIYDNFVNFDASVYRLGEQPENLGTFSFLNADPVITFTPYQTEHGLILQHIAVSSHAADTSSSETEEKYIQLKDGKIHVETLYYTSYDGEDTFYNMESDEIAQEEFEMLRKDILGDAMPLDPLYLETDQFIDCYNRQAVEDYVTKLLTEKTVSAEPEKE